MKKILALLIAGSLLGGCTYFEKAKLAVDTAVQNIVEPDTVEGVMIAYNGAQKIALTYGRWCVSLNNAKAACWKVIKDLKPYEDKATRAVLALDDYSRQYPTATNTNLILAAKAAIKAYKDTQFINGVQ